MSAHHLDQLRVVTSRVEEQLATLRRLGLDETAFLLEMAVLDLNRQVYECSATLGTATQGARALKASRH
jgi:hypothetical protein